MFPAYPVLMTTPYVPQARALFARFTTEPTTERKGLINNLIKSLLLSGVWSKLDAFYMLAAADAQSSLLNWVSTSYNLTAVNSPAFVADRGYTGDGSTSYLDTGFNPTTAPTPKFVQNSAALGVWVRTASTVDRIEIGSRTTSTTAQSVIFARSTSNTAIGRLNLNTGGPSAAVATSVGHTAISRTGSGASELFKDGASIATDATASVAVASLNMFIGAVNNAGTPQLFSARQIATAHIGAGVSAAEALASYNAINTYLVAIGAA